MKKLALILGAIIIALFCLVVGYWYFNKDNDPIEVPISENVNSNCSLETCHGLEYECGDNPPEACTMMYAIGDRCLQYAECGTVNGVCQQIENPQFTQCKNCVQNCIDENGNNSLSLFECESNCI